MTGKVLLGAVTGIALLIGGGASALASPTTTITLSGGCSDSTAPTPGLASISGSCGVFSGIVSGGPQAYPKLLASGVIDLNTTGLGTATINVTTTGLTEPVGVATLWSGFTVNAASGISVTESTLINGSPIASQAFLPSAGALSDNAYNVVDFTSPFSITELYVLKSSGTGGSVTATINTAVPEPASIAILLVGLIGLVGFKERHRFGGAAKRLGIA